jgi:hypothetical protein
MNRTSPMEAQMNGIHTWQFALASTLTFAILYGICAVAVVLFPDGTLDFLNNWFHGLDLRLLKPPAGRTLRPIQFASGLASVAVVSFSAGALLASSYILFSRTMRRR